MSEYTPTLFEVQAAYLDRKDFEDQVTHVERRGDDAALAEFDRWFAKVKAEAWEEGWDAAYKMARGWGHVDGWQAPWPENPYV